ncbi:MAG: hypothetical protein J7M20_08910 [Deltaproteobacteria bacterium]|nr:hypothetical protein [Deltaproteobacteria bacterium]
MSKPNSPYQKYIYWLTQDQESQLDANFEIRNIKLKHAKGIVCTPLDRINKITSVAPEVWDETCVRQGSWYRTSDKNSLYLVISSFELENFETQKAAVITESDFVLPQPASLTKKQLLFEDPRLQEKMPARWRHVDEMEKRIYLRWAKRLGSSVQDYDQLYMTHTANHANFITPKFFIETSESIVPYSIDKSAHLCSCCVELFQVLGSEFKKKLVAPCPGATIFARLKPNRYLLVEKP